MNEDTRPSTVDPAGPDAAAIAELWWWMFGVATAICVLVVVLMLLALRRAHRREAPTELPWTRSFVLGLGVVMPIAILVPLSIGTMFVGRETHRIDDAPLVVDVIGHQFWWEVRYPDLGVVTANEIHVPVGTEVEFRLATADVIHSFWVPRLGGKLDMIPGRVNSYSLRADEPGVYEGICAEFCGIQHARMHFVLVAEEQEEFDAWAQAQAEPATEDLSEGALAGREVFRTSSCAQCHRVAGVSEAEIGPDLTHLASRRTLAAGLLENNRGHLAGWVMDPQGIKPGARMPGSSLNGVELAALLDYLEELE